MKVCSEATFVVVVDLDPVDVAERFTLVHLMTMNMMANRTTAMTIGTPMAAALLFSFLFNSVLTAKGSNKPIYLFINVETREISLILLDVKFHNINPLFAL